jgi:hypothetical protein
MADSATMVDMATTADMATTMEGMEVGIIKYHYFPVVGPAAALPQQASRNRSPFCLHQPSMRHFQALKCANERQATSYDLLRTRMHHFGNKEQGARPTQLTNVQCAGLSPRSLFKSEIGFFLDNIQKHQRPIAHPPAFPALAFPHSPVLTQKFTILCAWIAVVFRKGIPNSSLSSSNGSSVQPRINASIE